MNNLFGVYTFPWGSAVRNETTGEWTNVFKSPYGEMVVVEGLNVGIDDDGVHFTEVDDDS